MNYKRSAGILLHPTSLSSRYGIGDIGSGAFQWIDFLHKANCGLWQVLPLGPTGYADSPYQSFSAFAGNPYLISLDDLISDGLLSLHDLENAPAFPDHRVDYGMLIPWKMKVLQRAFNIFETSQPKKIKQEFEAFYHQHTDWLDDFSLFMALKDSHHGAPWHTWETPLRRREPHALTQAASQYADTMRQHSFNQFLFFRQWERLHDYARKMNITIIGDIPIFVAHDSAEVWKNPDLFFISKDGQPSVVAGVPPDYFSPTGQLWGNPLYRWKIHKKTGYAWWLKRFRSVLSMVDIIRLDHFRGFAGYWEIPGSEHTAINGRWVPGPGEDFFKVMQAELGKLPILAEDLGVITPDVTYLRQKFNLPGMKILVFAFDDGPEDPDLPHHYTNDCVVYTGTHDNDTVRGWYERVSEEERDFARRYLKSDAHDISWDLIRAAWASSAIFSLTSMPDMLSLDNQARMNYPSRPEGNWQWRMPHDALRDDLAFRLAELNWLYSRGANT